MKFVAVCTMVGLLLCLVEGSEPEDERGGKFVVSRSTKIVIVITTSTTTTPLSCRLAANPDACQRRRYRRYNLINDIDLSKDDLGIDGSLVNPLEGDDSLVEGNREGRIAATIVFRTTSTITAIVTSTNDATTFSLSYFCTVSGAALAPLCG